MAKRVFSQEAYVSTEDKIKQILFPHLAENEEDAPTTTASSTARKPVLQAEAVKAGMESMVVESTEKDLRDLLNNVVSKAPPAQHTNIHVNLFRNMVEEEPNGKELRELVIIVGAGVAGCCAAYELTKV